VGLRFLRDPLGSEIRERKEPRKIITFTQLQAKRFEVNMKTRESEPGLPLHILRSAKSQKGTFSDREQARDPEKM
jgi:hypothetical protein